MDSNEDCHRITRSGVVRAKPAVTVDGKIETAGEGLPHGWLKEYRPRKNQSGSRIKGDTFYIDPTNMYEFRSLKDVHRYLESGDVTNCVMIQNKRKIEDLHTTRNQSHNTRRSSDQRQLDAGKGSTQCDVPIAGGNNTQNDAMVNANSSDNAEDMSSSEPKGVSKGRLTRLRLQKERVPNQSVEHEYSTGEANLEHKPREKKQKTKPVKQIPTPLRASPRLAALKINQEASNVPKNEPFSMQSDTGNYLQPKLAKSPKAKANSTVPSEKNDGAHTSIASENAKNKYPSATEQIQGSSVHPQQVGTADAMPGSALSSLLRSIWSDPCLKFAFKTLTSDIPALDFIPSQDLNKGTTPNCSSSAYDGSRNHAQVDHVRMPMPRPSDKFYSSGWFPPQ
uniref:MBD domain-containing protein n=1 Tax=Leersia perrieri TaxID=77586 RepID=A0A0D9W9D7_9ORYZ